MTTWQFDEASGLLTNKTDAAGQSVSYTYTLGGRPATRTWSRLVGAVLPNGDPLITTYSYNSAGDLSGVDYSDSTPDVSFTYDRLGRQKTASSSVSAHAFAYNGLLLATETIVSSAGTNVIARSYDSLSRSIGFSVAGVADPGYSVAYNYDPLGRFSSVTSTNVGGALCAATYSYLANSDLIETLSTDNGLLITRSYEDHRNLLTEIENSLGTNVISSYTYANDALGRRTSVKQSGTGFQPVGDAFNLYGYNSRSELVSADRYWGADINDISQPVAGQN
ncbi:MAG: hypothetical protein HYV36_00160 [Lentisphaerae bacterium]|nr:hypothetical protein [Lentisphaerota bacterium]